MFMIPENRPCGFVRVSDGTPVCVGGWFLSMVGLLIGYAGGAGAVDVSTPIVVSPIAYVDNPGIRLWDVVNDRSLGYLDRCTNGNWRTANGVAALPKSDRHIVYTRSSGGLGIWDTRSNTNVGFVGPQPNTGGNWGNLGTDIAFDPENDAHLVYALESGTGLRVFDLSQVKTIGPYINVTNGNWRGTRFDILPGQRRWIVYGTSGGLRLWDAVENRDAGSYARVAGGEWRLPLLFPPSSGEAPSPVFPSHTRLVPESVSVEANGTARFSTRIEGARPVRYAWLNNGVVVGTGMELGSEHTNVVELVLTKVSVGMEGTIQIELQNHFATLTSAPALLEVNGVTVDGYTAQDLEWQSRTNEWYRVEGFTVGSASSRIVPWALRSPATAAAVDDAGENRTVEAGPDPGIRGWTIAPGAPMALRRSPEAPWQWVTNPAEWFQGSGRSMRVVFSLRVSEQQVDRSMLFRIAVAGTQPSGVGR